MFDLRARLSNKREAATIYAVITIASALSGALIFTSNLVYQITIAHLMPLQLILVGTTLEITYFIFQIPTGIAADLYSRRRSVIIGYALSGFGFFLESQLPIFGGILLAQVLWGAGAAFTSGAEEAWLTDELGEDGAAVAFVRGARLGSIAGLVGIGLSVILGSINIALPVAIGGLGFLALAAFLIVAMPETNFRPQARLTTGWRAPVIGVLRTGLRLTRTQVALQVIIVLGLFYGLYSESYDRLWTDHLLNNFIFPTIGTWQPIVWFGIMQAGVQLLSIGGASLIERRGDARSAVTQVRALHLIAIGQVISLIAFALAGNFLMAVLTFWLFGTLRSVSHPLWTGWINRQMESDTRATMHSFAGQIDAIGQIVGGPVIGSATNALIIPIGLGGALRVGLLLAALTLSPMILLYRRAQRLKVPEEVIQR